MEFHDRTSSEKLVSHRDRCSASHEQPEQTKIPINSDLH